MKRLATKCWADNNTNSKNGTYCRMEWIKNQCKEYFLKGGKAKYDKKEHDISIKLLGHTITDQTLTICENVDSHIESVLEDFHNQRISILDVGSCYNPLSVENAFDVTAIDLTPIPGEVFQCDFLNVVVGKEKVFSENKREIYQLPTNSFDAVIFSLFLGYLPCPKQRYLCCKNAYDVLKYGGILIIVSPDSKHVGANAKLIKSWRYTLSKLGFMRIKYEKLRHMHCLAFKKCKNKNAAARWADMQCFSENNMKYISNTEIFIPQDFGRVYFEEKQEKIECNEIKYDETDLVNIFSEMPFDDKAICEEEDP